MIIWTWLRCLPFRLARRPRLAARRLARCVAVRWDEHWQPRGRHARPAGQHARPGARWAAELRSARAAAGICQAAMEITQNRPGPAWLERRLRDRLALVQQLTGVLDAV